MAEGKGFDATGAKLAKFRYFGGEPKDRLCTTNMGSTG
jgi:hypothetical protein